MRKVGPEEQGGKECVCVCGGGGGGMGLNPRTQHTQTIQPHVFHQPWGGYVVGLAATRGDGLPDVCGQVEHVHHVAVGVPKRDPGAAKRDQCVANEHPYEIVDIGSISGECR